MKKAAFLLGLLAGLLFFALLFEETQAIHFIYEAF
jgi:hypothetical protein